MTDININDASVDQKAKDAYFTASQGQLIWTRFKKQKAAMVGAWVLVFLVLSGLFAPFLTPYDPTIPQFCDDNGCSLRPFVYALERERSIKTNFRWVTTVNTDKRQYVYFFVDGDPYKLFGMKFSTHLFGLDEGYLHLFGTDSTGKDIFSRTFHAINTSLAGYPDSTGAG